MNLPERSQSKNLKLIFSEVDAPTFEKQIFSNRKKIGALTRNCDII